LRGNVELAASVTIRLDSRGRPDIAHAGGEAPVAAIEERVWEQVAAAYGYQLDDAAERRHVDRLVQGIFAQLADLGAAEHIDQGVRLTELGGALAAAASAVIDDDDELLE
jgi:hypothetical protein